MMRAAGVGMATFGQILRQVRERAGLTQRQLADLAGTTQRTVSFWEADKRDPTLGNLQTLCAALAVTGDVFLASERAAPLRPPGRPPGRVMPGSGEWTAAEDELVRTLDPANAAARTGRGMGAVYERRRVLRMPDGRRRGSAEGG
jgi:transcriptional regulator with XRE-family HTH domain